MCIQIHLFFLFHFPTKHLWGTWKCLSMLSVLIWISSLRHLKTYEYVFCTHLNFFIEAPENIWVCCLFSSEFLHWGTWKHMGVYSVLIRISLLRHLKTYGCVFCTHQNFFTEAFENIWVCILYSSEFLHWGTCKHKNMFSVLIWISTPRHLKIYGFVFCTHLNFFIEALENIWVCCLFSSEFLHWGIWKHMSMLSVLILITSLRHLKTCWFFFCAHQKYLSKELENICCMYLSSEVPQWVHFDDNSLLIQFGWKIKHFMLI